MQSVPVRQHQHRHYKTLIVLVLAMTGGMLFLFWVAELAPVTPLRSQLPAAAPWDRILVKAQDLSSPKGFCHFYIDEQGQPFKSRAWEDKREEPGNDGAIVVIVGCESSDGRLTNPQATALSRVIADLRAQHRIRGDRVEVVHASRLASSDSGEF